MSTSRFAILCLAAALLAGCDDQPAAPPAVRPVRAIIVQPATAGEPVSATGHIAAQDQASLAFRLDGRLIERKVNVGDTVKPGQVIARLESQIQQNSLRQAQANLSAAQGQLVQARNTFARQQNLLKDGFTPQSSYDQAQQALQTAEAQLDAAKAQLRNAEEQLSYTQLVTDVAGTVTAKGAEPGEIVAAGRMIVEIARQGGRDAVFDLPAVALRTVPSDIVVDIALSDEPTVKTTGHVREVAPQADPTTRTFRVKVGLDNPPPAMRLGATVTGRIQLATPAGVEIPASALTETQGRPAVWVVDPATKTVGLRNVAIVRHDPASVVVSEGLGAGELVVTAGVQALRPSQKVRLLGSAQ
jgi:RND family efflux transporter MFP subunit